MEEGEYTRLRANVQLGDGPDQRGDITLEMVRSVEKEELRSGDRRKITVAEAVEPEMIEQLGLVDTARVYTNDSTFAEFVFELDRATTLLEEELGL